MKRLFVLVFVLALLPAATAVRSCQAPESTIRNSVTFCGMNYYLTHGITIAADNIEVDCGNAVLQGTIVHGRFQYTGITLLGRTNVTLRNCKIALYETGMLIKDATDITVIDSSFIRNKFGVFLINARMNHLERNHDISIQRAVRSINSTQNVVSYANKKFSGDFCRTNVCNEQPILPAVYDLQSARQGETRSLLRALKESIQLFIST